MRERILEIIKEENKKLNPMDIMSNIKKDSTVEDYQQLMHELDLLCRDGIIRTANGNTYVMNEQLMGVVDMHEKGNAHILVKGGDDIFIPRDKLRGACDKDYVIYEITDKEKGEGVIKKILRRSLGRGIGEVVNEDGNLYVKILDKNLPYAVEVEKEDAPCTLVDGLYVHLEYIKELNKNRVLAHIDYPIGHKNAAGKSTEYALIASEFDRPLFFPEETKEETKIFPQSLSEQDIIEAIKNGVVDHRGDIVTTTDGKDTKDIDDAIQVEILPNGNYRVIVHIADVSRYVKPGSAIWDYALLKGNSDYFANKVGPMLPIELSNGICSLNPNEDRFAVSCEMEINHAGEVVDRNVHLSIIKSKKKMNYDAVQDIIENKETEDTKDYTVLKYTVKKGETIHDIAFKNCITVEELLEVNDEKDFVEGNEINVPTKSVIKLMNKISSVMGAHFERRGKIEFEGHENKHIFDENDEVIDKEPRVQREAEKIIEHFMIYANESFASYVCEKISNTINNVAPFVFRVHGSPNPKKIEEFMKILDAFGIHYNGYIDPNNCNSKDIQKLIEYLKNQDNFKVLNDRLLRCMQKAVYSENLYGHFGIASELYCHFTSPIRRMADLIIHTIYREFIVEKDYSKENINKWMNMLSETCEHISECERSADAYERAVEDYNDARYMKKHIGESFEATVVDVAPGHFYIETNEKHISGRIETILDENAIEELKQLTDPEEIKQCINSHIRLFDDDFSEDKFAYTRKGRVILRLGDQVIATCIDANEEEREVGFALVRKK